MDCTRIKLCNRIGSRGVISPQSRTTPIARPVPTPKQSVQSIDFQCTKNPGPGWGLGPTAGIVQALHDRRPLTRKRCTPSRPPENRWTRRTNPIFQATLLAITRDDSALIDPARPPIRSISNFTFSNLSKAGSKAEPESPGSFRTFVSRPPNPPSSLRGR